MCLYTFVCFCGALTPHSWRGCLGPKGGGESVDGVKQGTETNLSKGRWGRGSGATPCGEGGGTRIDATDGDSSGTVVTTVARGVRVGLITSALCIVPMIK